MEHMTEDEKVLHNMGYAQELARRMSGFSNFAISFSIICILAGGITAFPVAFSSGGGFSVSIGWLVGGFFALVVAASVGQIASAYPTAGGLYHWASILGGRGWGWLCAWINLVGLIFVVASVNFGVYLLLKDLVITGVFGVDTSAWGALHASIFVTIFAVTQALFNHFGIKITTMLTDFSGYLIFVVAIGLTLSMLIWGASFDLSRLFTFVNNSGEPGGLVVPEPRTALVAFLIGLLYPLYTITGFDASAHTSEETINARSTVPKGMLNSVFWSLLFGFFLASSFVLAMPDTTVAAKDGFNSFFNLFNTLPMPELLRDLLAIGIVIANYICGLAGMTSTSRMIYAFARDGGLPASKALATIHPKHRTPVNAIWLTAALSAGACYYAPFMFALAAGCALFLYISYAMPVAAGLFAEGKTWTEYGPFRLGAWSKPFAIITIIGVVILAYAGIQPPFNPIILPLFPDLVFPLNQLTNPLIFLAVAMGLGWFLSERKRFKGPPIGEEIKRRQAEIAAREKALDAAEAS
ncbi:amino acid permease [Aestuariivirga litoralis]|uniref:Amino acid permease n=1 Tax=Aestuariivirga litoralis TaxID=2650924 RepID=A0A2W2BSX8_9HYPH|nr:amino acid permease [Aestuariivirga litoralis]PZF76546.1 amino acid permease [Aestuariivirga litoralis]